MIQGEASSVFVDELAAYIKEDLDYYNSIDIDSISETNKCMICKVPNRMLVTDRKAYEPMIVSIGPYHNGVPSLLKMEREKWNRLGFILKLNPERNFQDYLKEIQAIENQARNSSYSQGITMESDRFVQMLVLDGFFLIETLYGTKGIVIPNQVNHRKYQLNADVSGFLTFVVHDILLLENQIPFFVIKKILELLVGKERTPAHIEEIVKFVEDLLSDFPLAIQESDRPRDFHHILHLLHVYFRPTRKSKEYHPYLYKHLNLGPYKVGNEHNSSLNSHQLPKQWSRALEYLEAGVEFKKKHFDKQNPHSLLDITLANDVLEIPCLTISEYTVCIFRNLIAFEQTCPQFGNDFTAYIIFMSQLVSLPEDAKLLVKRGIIVHVMDTDEEVSTLITKLSKGLVFDFNLDYYLKSLYCKMEAYRQNRQNRWMAWLWRNRRTIAIAVVVMLICTIVRTFFTILSYFKPAKIVFGA